MQKQTVILTAIFALSAVAGYLSKALVDDDKISRLKTDLRVANFKGRILRHAYEAALEEVPMNRTAVVTEKLDTAIQFEQIIADQN